MSELNVTSDGDVLTVELDRPEAGNSVNDGMLNELEVLLCDESQFHDVAAVIFTGIGDKFFCAGGDVKFLSTLSVQHVSQFTARARAALIAIENLPVTTVAAINGYAIGGGLELALACDYRLARPSAKMSMPQLSLGLIPGWHGIERLRRVIGHRAARNILFSARPVEANAAHDIGLIDHVSSDSENWTTIIAGYAREQAAVTEGRSSLVAVRRTLVADNPLKAEDATLVTFTELWASEAHREAEGRFARRKR